MKITGNDYEISRHVNETTSLTQEKEQTEKTSALTPEPSDDVIVNLSEASKEVQKAKEVIESEPDVRSEEVNAIRAQIEEGAYEVDQDRTAEQMVGQFINEVVG